MPGGRPSSYTPEIAEVICSEIAMDNATLEELCERDGMPSRAAVWRWQQDNEAFRNAYARAREEQAHSIVDKQDRLRRKVERGEVEPSVALASHKIGSWVAGKRLPKVYGDRQVLAGDPDAPLTKPASTEDLLAMLKPELEAAWAKKGGGKS